MKIQKVNVLVAMIVPLLGVGSISTSHASDYLDSSTKAKLSRSKAHSRIRLNAESPSDVRMSILRNVNPEDSQTPCGAIDLGNVENASVFQGPRSVTVIIDGDVINADNHCR